MSVFNALTTAVSGINAQSTAFTNLSNNIANSQTVGYKADTTAFQNFVAGSLIGNTASADVSDSVSAITVQHVDDQGTPTSSSNSLSSAISGNGLFVVSKATGASSTSTTQFSNQSYFTRNGEFSQNNQGYLVNTSGYYMDGYMVDPSSGQLGTTVTQINVGNVAYRPPQTNTLTLTATVGTMPANTANYTAADAQTYTTAPVTVYDANATQHHVALTWSQSTTNPLVWTASAYDADGTGAINQANNTYNVTFNSNGTLASVTDSTGAAVGSTASGAAVTLPITASYGTNSTQTINLSLGTIGGTSGTIMAQSTGTASKSAVSSLTLDSANATLTENSAQIGTTTGSNQSYMTSPIEVSGTPVSLRWSQTSASPPTWSVSAINSSTGAALSASSSITFNANGTANSPPTSLSATINGQAYTVNLPNMTNAASPLLSTSSSLGLDTTALTSDSIGTGTYQGVQIQGDGSVMAQFSNGASQLVGKIALANFANVNGLNAVDGQAYTATSASGNPAIGTVGANGTGTLSVGYTESSTTNLTSDLSALIVAQEAYSANTKVITTADTLLQATIAMKQ
ncbi:flagellar biosynthesis protein FlgE [Asaia sp. W19]|uniref:flagellar hook-basal body complex protein n=1 Tax=unclassified Asaia TaxID=2685023 RepID=UPI000F8D6CE0|nr:flagellar hook-basal body complex protein [Asaia sp. W19]RUT26206.1 flagellar biosynthesis protein FlgE [Asaia sp. W19]